MSGAARVSSFGFPHGWEWLGMTASIYVFFIHRIIFGVGGLRAADRVRLEWGSFWEWGNMMGVFICV